MKKIEWEKLGIAIAICFIPAIVGYFSMGDSLGSWYETLDKPWFTPPNWVFAPVWTILYILMGISLYLILTTNIKKNFIKRTLKEQALTYFTLQLALNFIWTPVFFSAHELFISMLVILVLDLATAVTIWTFYKINKNAGYLLAPYIGWLAIASILNIWVWFYN